MNRTLKQNPSHPTRLLLVAVCTLLMLCIAHTGFAQQAAPAPAAAATAAKPAAVESAAAVPNSASAQGVKVHGHWVIDVKNPDGTLAQHREFENSLVDFGFNLTTLLAGNATVGEPVIYLSSGGASTTFCGYLYCYLSEYSNGEFMKEFNSGAGCPVASACVATLVPTIVITGSGVNTVFSLKLAGQMTATQAGSITSVSTYLWNCATAGLNVSNVPPSSCASQTNVPANTIVSAPGGSANPQDPFTGTTITGVAITSGQVVQVSVTLSFS